MRKNSVFKLLGRDFSRFKKYPKESVRQKTSRKPKAGDYSNTNQKENFQSETEKSLVSCGKMGGERRRKRGKDGQYNEWKRGFMWIRDLDFRIKYLMMVETTQYKQDPLTPFLCGCRIAVNISGHKYLGIIYF